MTEQEIFSKVVTHLMTQGERSGEFWDCKYRSDDGLQCAVGCLIKEEHYSEVLEGLKATSPKVVDALDKSGIPTTTSIKWLLRDLQVVHDANSPDEWESRLVEIASKRKLKLPPVLGCSA